MAANEIILKNAALFLHDKELSGFSNEIRVKANADLKVKTCFGDASIRRKAGLHDCSVQFNGLIELDVDGQENTIFPKVGAATDLGFSAMAQSDGAAGVVAYFMNGRLDTYDVDWSLGELGKFQGMVYNRDGGGLIRGLVLENGAKSSSGNGTAQTIVGPGAAQKVYVVVHCLGVGTSEDITIQSAASGDPGFSSPTTRFTVPQFTATGSYFSSLSGAITDTLWRATWNPVGGDSTIVVCVGVK